MVAQKLVSNVEFFKIAEAEMVKEKNSVNNNWFFFVKLKYNEKETIAKIIQDRVI